MYIGVCEMDNKGAVELVNNFSCGGRTRHIETRQCYLRELKAERLMVVKWRAGVDMSSDLYRKTLPRPDFKRHARDYVGADEYMK
jgi:hypothetical protein